jgi:RimJ/RimL family protein N-acetyltransferase
MGMTLYADRQAIAPLLRTHSPADALAAYYALRHSELRTRLVVHRDERNTLDGFIAVCRTGFDLFQPLVVMRASTSDVAAWLLHNGLSSDRPYQVVVPPSLAPTIEANMNAQAAATHLIFEARRASFTPVINVLVMSSRGPDSAMRFIIRAADGTVVAESGTNWRSDEFAEVFVQVEFAVRGRGLGKSVASACTAYLLDCDLRPLYIVDENNTESVSIAQALGYTDTGASERVYVGSLRGSHA